MCGRLCCYCKYSTYPERFKNAFKDLNTGVLCDDNLFQPTANLSPTHYVPIIHAEEDDLFIRPMKWGIQMDQVRNHNTRLETLTSKKYFQRLAMNRTCGIMCDGFYEWKGKKPFFFYNGQSAFDPSAVQKTWTNDDWIDQGPPILILAGYYSVDKANDLHTFSVITKEATGPISAVHHRTPTVLDNETNLMNWLNLDNKPMDDILNQLTAINNDHLAYYEVHHRVNSTQYQQNDCHFPKPSAPASGPMDAFLSKMAKPSDSGLEQSTSKRKTTSLTHSPIKKSKASLPASNPLAKWLVKKETPTTSSQSHNSLPGSSSENSSPFN